MYSSRIILLEYLKKDDEKEGEQEGKKDGEKNKAARLIFWKYGLRKEVYWAVFWVDEERERCGENEEKAGRKKGREGRRVGISNADSCLGIISR